MLSSSSLLPASLVSEDDSWICGRQIIQVRLHETAIGFEMEYTADASSAMLDDEGMR